MADEDPPVDFSVDEEEFHITDNITNTPPLKEYKENEGTLRERKVDKRNEDKPPQHENDSSFISPSSPPPSFPPTHKSSQIRYVRRITQSPLYTPSFNHKDWAFFAGLALVTVLAFGTRLYTLSEPPHVA